MSEEDPQTGCKFTGMEDNLILDEHFTASNVSLNSTSGISGISYVTRRMLRNNRSDNCTT